MIPDHQRRVINDRFTHWEQRFIHCGAFPAVSLGLTTDQPPELLICTSEEVDIPQLIDLLEQVVGNLRQQHRQPLDMVSPSMLMPTSGGRELRELNLVQELQDALAGVGIVMETEVIRGWSSQQFFQAFYYARRLRDQTEPVDFPSPRKPSFLPWPDL